MKKVLSLTILLLGLFIYAKAAEGDYIIRYNQNVPRFFSAEITSFDSAGITVVSKEKADALNNAGLLEFCVADRVVTLYDTAPNDTLYSQQYNLGKIKADYAWGLKTYGNDVRVGIIDSGLFKNHPDIDYANVLDGWNFGVFSDEENYNTLKFDTSDSVGHGTMVAGIIAAKRNNSLGVCGIADKVKLVPLKVQHIDGNVYISSVINAIMAGADYFDCDVINMSLGVGTTDTELIEVIQLAVDYALERNCILVAASGNNNTNDPGDHLRYPAACSGVISVGYTTESDVIADSSVANESVFVCAPANKIPVISISSETGYATASGTSFASPQVVAAAAIAKNIDPYITPTEFAQSLKNTATDLGDSGRDIYYGYGLLNTQALVDYLMEDRGVYVSPFEEDTSSVTLFNRTSSPISATSIFSLYSYYNEKMLKVDAVDAIVPASGSLIRTFSFNDAGLLKHFLWKTDYPSLPYDSWQHYRKADFLPSH